LFLQSRDAFRKETLSPAADDLTAAVEAGGNLVVVQPLRSQQDHLGALDLKIR
jgi:hypothetical protein